jgi:hypothetical protein
VYQTKSYKYKKKYAVSASRLGRQGVMASAEVELGSGFMKVM